MSSSTSLEVSTSTAPSMGVTATIVGFLRENAQPDLVERIDDSLEFQANMSAEGGVPNPNGTGWITEDGLLSWHNIRVPKDAATTPHFRDYPLRFDFPRHVECIGSTGWDWRQRRSRWVGFDFDSIVGHKAGLAPDAILRIQEAVYDLDYVEVRKSTSGTGLHLYVRVDVETPNHTEHAALAKFVLDQMSRDAGVDLSASVDCFGAVLWLWSRRATPENSGLTLVKAATAQFIVPEDWRPAESIVWAELAQSQPKADMLARHWRIVDAIKAAGYVCEWDAEHHCIKTHTKGLEAAHRELKLPGDYSTTSNGAKPQEANCFAFPLKSGFKVVRYGNATEPTWTKGKFTTCLYGVEPEDVAKVEPARSASDPTELAEFHIARTKHDGERTLVFIKGQLYVWTDGVYRPVESIAYSPYVSESIRIAKQQAGSTKAVRRSNIGDTLAQIHDLCKLKTEDDTGPFWIDRRGDDWEPDECIVFSNGILNVERWRNGDADHFRAHTPRLFVRSKLGFEYDPKAPEPVEWHKFLASIWDDPQMKLLLQMWLGYVMVSDCSLHKFLLMIGAARGGKGTIAGVMEDMVGGCSAAPKYASLTKEHGLAALIGKRLAIFPDQGVVKPSEMMELGKLLKGLSADDKFTINPKFQQQFSAKLKIKIVLQSNDDLCFVEDSNALRARQLFLVFTKSFAGKEDYELPKKLKAESAGIALWALEGYRLLRENGNRFVEPEASKRLADETHSKSNPVGEFVRECCLVGEKYQVRKEDLHKRFVQWASDREQEPLDERTFGKRLLANCRDVDGSKRESTGDRKKLYVGIGVSKWT